MTDKQYLMRLMEEANKYTAESVFSLKLDERAGGRFDVIRLRHGEFYSLPCSKVNIDDAINYLSKYLGSIIMNRIHGELKLSEWAA